ncbi:MAG: prepilin-type N-terminal cleavage/methylation domain-containing protein, partial [Pseudomonadota bacterium]|nr:prepilin-type N-terminal cleavage/methylation domain-containing protein [Pseudomonadota bacterium]
MQCDNLPCHPLRLRSAYAPQAIRGFTLIELMLVIVIMGVFAAIVGLSVGGAGERRLLVERERLMDNLSIIRLESIDQGRVLGLLPT